MVKCYRDTVRQNHATIFFDLTFLQEFTDINNSFFNSTWTNITETTTIGHYETTTCTIPDPIRISICQWKLTNDWMWCDTILINAQFNTHSKNMEKREWGMAMGTANPKIWKQMSCHNAIASLVECARHYLRGTCNWKHMTIIDYSLLNFKFRY